jgi:hypothetical protein
MSRDKMHTCELFFSQKKKRPKGGGRTPRALAITGTIPESAALKM